MRSALVVYPFEQMLPVRTFKHLKNFQQLTNRENFKGLILIDCLSHAVSAILHIVGYPVGYIDKNNFTSKYLIDLLILESLITNSSNFKIKINTIFF